MHLGGDALDRVDEAEMQLGLEVGAALGPGPARRAACPPPTAGEEAAEQVGDVVGAEREAARTLPAEAARHGTHAADLVVLLALLGVADDVVGGRHLLEPLLGLGVAR